MFDIAIEIERLEVMLEDTKCESERQYLKKKLKELYDSLGSD